MFSTGEIMMLFGRYCRVKYATSHPLAPSKESATKMRQRGVTRQNESQQENVKATNYLYKIAHK